MATVYNDKHLMDLIILAIEIYYFFKIIFIYSEVILNKILVLISVAIIPKD